jgi:hypothetical protein
VLNLCNNKLSGSLDAITNMAKEPPAPEEVVVNGKVIGLVFRVGPNDKNMYIHTCMYTHCVWAFE